MPTFLSPVTAREYKQKSTSWTPSGSETFVLNPSVHGRLVIIFDNYATTPVSTVPTITVSLDPNFDWDDGEDVEVEYKNAARRFVKVSMTFLLIGSDDVVPVHDRERLILRRSGVSTSLYLVRREPVFIGDVTFDGLELLNRVCDREVDSVVPAETEGEIYNVTCGLSYSAGPPNFQLIGGRSTAGGVSFARIWYGATGSYKVAGGTNVADAQNKVIGSFAFGAATALYAGLLRTTSGTSVEMVLKSTNGGSTWAFTADLPDAVATAYPLYSASAAKMLVYVSGANELYLTDDGGATWATEALGPDARVYGGAVAASGRFVLVGDDGLTHARGQIWGRDNSGVGSGTWEVKFNHPSDNTTIQSITGNIAVGDAGLVYGTSGDWSLGSVFMLPNITCLGELVDCYAIAKLDNLYVVLFNVTGTAPASTMSMIAVSPNNGASFFTRGYTGGPPCSALARLDVLGVRDRLAILPNASLFPSGSPGSFAVTGSVRSPRVGRML